MSTGEPRKKVWICFANSTAFGPGKVVENLLKGIAKTREENGVELVSKPSKADFVGCLQNPHELAKYLPSKSLMGPNIFVLPIEMPELCNKFTNFVTPSAWVRDKYATFPLMQGKTIYAWPVGIDTEEWSDKRKKPVKDFFVYQKNTPQAVVDKAIRAFEAQGSKCAGVVTYGKYNNDDLKAICDATKFSVLCTNTESQGIAYMGILSSGTPCYVVNEAVWKYDSNKVITAAATSVPYFDFKCGMAVDVGSPECLGEETVAGFLQLVREGSFDPRQYILENHTLEMSAMAYLDILSRSFAS